MYDVCIQKISNTRIHHRCVSRKYPILGSVVDVYGRYPILGSVTDVYTKDIQY